MNRATLTDGWGLAISTASVAAAARYVLGVELMLASSPAAESALRRATSADGRFGLAWIALAVELAKRDVVVESTRCAATATVHAAGATRRERQHVEVIRLLLNGHLRRAAVLGREHLREFPADGMVSFVLGSLGAH